MSHAHEIGLSLALRDGVAHSAVLAQSDIVAMDRATSANVIPLHDLQSTSNLISRLLSVVTPREAEFPVQIPEKLDCASDAKRVPTEVAPIKITGPATLLLTKLGDTVNPQGLSPVMQAVGETEVTSLPPKFTTPESAPTIQQPRKPEGTFDASTPKSTTSAQEIHAPWKTTSTQPSASTKIGEKVVILKMASEESSETSPLSTSRAAIAPAKIAMLSMPYQAPTVSAPGTAAAASAPVILARPQSSNVTWDAPVLTDSGTPNGGAAPLAQVRARPQSGEQFSEQRRVAGNVSAHASDLPSAPPANIHDQQHIEGDVYLDGTLVGRWISRFLSREASRSSAGPTGFDKRRSPLMPGASVGM